MADINIKAENWRELRGSANCFLPKMALAQSSTTATFSNSDLHRAGQAAGLKAFSNHIIGRALGRNAVTHAKAADFLVAYAGLPQEIRVAHGTIGEEHIVAAVLAMPTLKEFMDLAKLTASELSESSGVSVSAISHALEKGRVPGGVAYALHKALQAKRADLPPLELFATSNVGTRIGKKAVADRPFSLDDLLLPLPESPPNPWP